MAAEGPAATDLRFRGQIEDAAASVCRNVAEGFARFNPREFLQFVKYARSSLAELQDELHDGLQRRYFSEEDFNEAWALTVRTSAALASLGRYLRSRRAARNAQAITRRQSDRLVDRSHKDEP
jgi:four helix bundle protein